MQCQEQAVLFATDNEVDLDEIVLWSEHEGILDDFSKIKGIIVYKSN